MTCSFSHLFFFFSLRRLRVISPKQTKPPPVPHSTTSRRKLLSLRQHLQVILNCDLTTSRSSFFLPTNIQPVSCLSERAISLPFLSHFSLWGSKCASFRGTSLTSFRQSTRSAQDVIASRVPAVLEAPAGDPPDDLGGVPGRGQSRTSRFDKTRTCIPQHA